MICKNCMYSTLDTTGTVVFTWVICMHMHSSHMTWRDTTYSESESTKIRHSLENVILQYCRTRCHVMRYSTRYVCTSTVWRQKQGNKDRRHDIRTEMTISYCTEVVQYHIRIHGHSPSWKKKMSIPAINGDASFPDLPPPKRTLRGAKFVQRCWWLLLPLIALAVTFAFLPPQWRPDMVRRCHFRRFCLFCWGRFLIPTLSASWHRRNASSLSVMWYGVLCHLCSYLQHMSSVISTVQVPGNFWYRYSHTGSLLVASWELRAAWHHRKSFVDTSVQDHTHTLYIITATKQRPP